MIGARGATMNKWEPPTDQRLLRRVGKTGEELCEAGAVVCRIVIQGIDGVDPSSGKTNRERLEDELADVQAQIFCTVRDLDLDNIRMAERRDLKVDLMRQWESHFPGAPTALQEVPAEDLLLTIKKLRGERDVLRALIAEARGVIDTIVPESTYEENLLIALKNRMDDAQGLPLTEGLMQGRFELAADLVEARR